MRWLKAAAGRSGSCNCADKELVVCQLVLVLCCCLWVTPVTHLLQDLRVWLPNAGQCQRPALGQLQQGAGLGAGPGQAAQKGGVGCVAQNQHPAGHGDSELARVGSYLRRGAHSERYCAAAQPADADVEAILSPQGAPGRLKR